MPLTPEQRTANLARIAAAAVATEAATGVPAELCTAQCILESAWLEKAPGNNPFGIKARAGQPSTPVLTTEFLTPQQLDRVRASGKEIRSVEPSTGGKQKVMMVDQFAAFPTLADAFTAYANLLVKGKYFAPRFARYQEHKNLPQLLADMKGADGQPPYATAPDYDTKILQLVNQNNVKTALAAARPKTAGAGS
ncbi:MAG: glucosaminidase domain-containing protein [Acidobacteria bacterium]|nr:glucosaminidase domain-containing protein [Acidobacteriota bacterium]